MSETVYKELYEANKKLEFMQNTIMAIADRLSIATGIDIKEASMDALLDAVDAKFEVKKEETATDSE